MKYLTRIILFAILYVSFINTVKAEYVYILNDKCIEDLYGMAERYFSLEDGISVHRSSRGIVLRYKLEDIMSDYEVLGVDTYKKTKKIEYFLAKIKNPVIIEVHTEKKPLKDSYNLKNWEISSVIAGKIESIILKPRGNIELDRIDSVGYGEFLPVKNTSNNGGNYFNRVDIIILCNISGE